MHDTRTTPLASTVSSPSEFAPVDVAPVDVAPAMPATAPVQQPVAVTTDGESVRLGEELCHGAAVAVYLETVAGTQMRADTDGNMTLIESTYRRDVSGRQSEHQVDQARRRAWFGARCETWTVGELPPIELVGDRSPLAAFVVLTDRAQAPMHYLSTHFEHRLAHAAADLSVGRGIG